ncbi:MAG: cupin domain-containing protein, partial [Elusimicrobia bacterium]|nr:cupin domain-containing protein [Elusimicrobiota bacterium]
MPKSNTEPQDVKGKALDAAKLLDYQAGGVVSRTLVQRPSGTVTIFAFDAGQGLSEHTAPFDALVLILEGEADIAIDGQAQRVQAG